MKFANLIKQDKEIQKEYIVENIKELNRLPESEEKIKEKIRQFMVDLIYTYAPEGDIEMMDFLLTSKDIPNPDIHMNKDQLFMLISNENIEMIKYLIFDYKIKETKLIKGFLEDNKKLDIQMMFKKRDLHNELIIDLANKKTIKKNKI